MSDENINKIECSNEAEDSESTTIEQPIKKKLGRPRIHPPKPEGEVKRPRGRPRIHPIPLPKPERIYKRVGREKEYMKQYKEKVYSPCVCNKCGTTLKNAYLLKYHENRSRRCHIKWLEAELAIWKNKGKNSNSNTNRKTEKSADEN